MNVDLIGLGSDAMETYVKFTADNLLSQLEYPKIYQVSNPFEWMNMINDKNKQNFFEGRVSEYKKYDGSTAFALDDDF